MKKNKNRKSTKRAVVSRRSLVRNDDGSLDIPKILMVSIPVSLGLTGIFMYYKQFGEEENKGNEDMNSNNAPFVIPGIVFPRDTLCDIPEGIQSDELEEKIENFKKSRDRYRIIFGRGRSEDKNSDNIIDGLYQEMIESLDEMKKTYLDLNSEMQSVKNKIKELEESREEFCIDEKIRKNPLSGFVFNRTDEMAREILKSMGDKSDSLSFEGNKKIKGYVEKWDEHNNINIAFDILGYIYKNKGGYENAKKYLDYILGKLEELTKSFNLLNEEGITEVKGNGINKKNMKEIDGIYRKIRIIFTNGKYERYIGQVQSSLGRLDSCVNVKDDEECSFFWLTPNPQSTI